VGRYEIWLANNLTEAGDLRHANYRPGWILIRDDDGRDFGWLRQRVPPGPSADAKRLRAWRQANGLSQKSAAKILGYSASLISRCELGRSSIPKPILAKLASSKP
jgi:Helix-turn-helix domain